MALAAGVAVLGPIVGAGAGLALPIAREQAEEVSAATRKTSRQALPNNIGGTLSKQRSGCAGSKIPSPRLPRGPTDYCRNPGPCQATELFCRLPVIHKLAKHVDKQPDEVDNGT